MTKLIDVVIPARNEADTIGPIIAAFQEVGYARTITVVCDTCTDDYATALAAANMMVNVRIGEYGGKGQAIAEGLNWVETGHVILCDGDLTGLTPDHIHQFACACPWQSVGVPDWPGMSPVPWPVRMDVFAQMSGQRSLPTEIVRSVPLHGYTVEAFLNRAVAQAGLETKYVRLEGVTGKVRNNGIRMAELRRDREWLAKNW